MASRNTRPKKQSPMQRPVPTGCLVAYIDMLGFRSFSTAFKTFPKAHSMMKCFCNAIDKLCQMPAFQKVRAYQGSDCVFVKDDVPDRVIRFVKLLYQHCAYHGVLLRGALAGGNFLDIRDTYDGFKPKSKAEFLPIWGDASTMAVKLEGILKGSRFFIDGDIQLDHRPTIAFHKVIYPDIVKICEPVAPDVTARLPHLCELLWHHPSLAADSQAFNQAVGGPAVPTLAEILQKLRSMAAAYRKAENLEGLAQVQRTFLLVSDTAVSKRHSRDDLTGWHKPSYPSDCMSACAHLAVPRLFPRTLPAHFAQNDIRRTPQALICAIARRGGEPDAVSLLR